MRFIMLRYDFRLKFLVRRFLFVREVVSVF